MNLNPLSKITQANIRTGTKFVIINWIVTMFVVVFVSVILPLLSMKFSIMVSVIDKLNPSSVIIALLGQSGIATAANTIRIAIENAATKKAEGPKAQVKE